MPSFRRWESKTGLVTSDQGQLDPPQQGIDVEVRDVELLLQRLLANGPSRYIRHLCC